MRPRLLALGAAVSVGVAPALALVAAHPAAAATKAIPGTLPALVRGATDLGAPPSARPMDLTLALSLRHRADLVALTKSLYDRYSPDHHRFLTPAQFANRFSPAPATVKAVTRWATKAGLHVTSVSPNRTLVQLSGSPAAVGRAFRATIHSFRAADGSTWLSPTAPASLPAALAGDVTSVVGLSTLGRVGLAPVVTRSAASAASSGLSFPASYRPQDFWSIYNAPASQEGSGQTIAILAEGDLTQVKADLVTFEAKFGLPQVPFSTVQVGSPSSDTSGQDEFDLDTQYSTGFAPQVSDLLVYDAPSLSDADILATINKFVTDDKAKQASFSAGECELLAQVSGFLPAADAALAQGVAQGQTLFTASGDTGSFCPALLGVNGVPLGIPGPNYPASSPDAVAVGGTTLLGGPGPLGEIAWYAGGGGLSALEPEPGYQAGVGGTNLGLNRGVPDVALDADPNTGYDVIVSGQEVTVGGTSASSPSWLGIWARAQAAHGASLGFANPTVYSEPATAFNDITVGGNGLYLATPGYDYVTGRGTPNISAFVAGA